MLRLPKIHILRQPHWYCSLHQKNQPPVRVLTQFASIFPLVIATRSKSKKWDGSKNINRDKMAVRISIIDSTTSCRWNCSSCVQNCWHWLEQTGVEPQSRNMCLLRKTSARTFLLYLSAQSQMNLEQVSNILFSKYLNVYKEGIPKSCWVSCEKLKGRKNLKES